MSEQNQMFPAVDEPRPETVTVVLEEPAPPTQAQTSMLESAVKATMEREVASVFQKIEAEKLRFEFRQRLSRLFVMARVFEDLKGSPEEALGKAMLKIELGESIGLAPAEAMRSIYFVRGRPELYAEVRAARMQRLGYSWTFSKLDDTGCIMDLYKNGKPILDASGKQAQVSFLEKDAKAAKLLEKDTYKTHPRNMYFARCITNAQRWYAAEALNGINFADPTERDEFEPVTGPPRPVFTREAAQ